MWQANKAGILALLIGFALLGGAYVLINPGNPQLAEQVLSLGVCLLLFGVGLASWLSVKKTVEQHSGDDTEDSPEDDGRGE